MFMILTPIPPKGATNIVVVDQSTIGFQNPTPTQIAEIQYAVNYDLYSHWTISRSQRGWTTVRLADVAHPPVLGEWVVTLSDYTDDPGAGGYHGTASGVPWAKVFAGTLQSFQRSVTEGLSHEIFEMCVNPDLLTLIVSYPGTGMAGYYQYEVCDYNAAASSNRTFPGLAGSSLASYVYPGFFVPGTSAPVDRTNHFSQALAGTQPVGQPFPWNSSNPCPSGYICQ